MIQTDLSHLSFSSNKQPEFTENKKKSTFNQLVKKMLVAFSCCGKPPHSAVSVQTKNTVLRSISNQQIISNSIQNSSEKTFAGTAAIECYSSLVEPDNDLDLRNIDLNVLQGMQDSYIDILQNTLKKRERNDLDFIQYLEINRDKMIDGMNQQRDKFIHYFSEETGSESSATDLVEKIKLSISISSTLDQISAALSKHDEGENLPALLKSTIKSRVENAQLDWFFRYPDIIQEPSAIFNCSINLLPPRQITDNRQCVYSFQDTNDYIKLDTIKSSSVKKIKHNNSPLKRMTFQQILANNSLNIHYHDLY